MARYLGAVLLLLTMLPGPLVGAGQVTGPAEFASLNLAARRELMRSVEQASQQIINRDVVLAIAAGLEDPDDGVRRKAAISLNHIFNPAPGRARTAAEMALVTESPRLRSVLARALGDSQFAVRGASADALLAMAPPLDPDSRTALIAAYYVEPDRTIRNVIVAGLAELALDSDDVRQLMVNALADEGTPARRSAARAVARFQPPEALPRIVAELRSGLGEGSDAWSARDAFVEALASYGERARPHLSVIEALMGAETHPGRQERMRVAIESIRDAR
jgi:HEAT repeat protein